MGAALPMFVRFPLPRRVRRRVSVIGITTASPPTPENVPIKFQSGTRVGFVQQGVCGGCAPHTPYSFAVVYHPRTIVSDFHVCSVIHRYDKMLSMQLFGRVIVC